MPHGFSMDQLSSVELSLVDVATDSIAPARITDGPPSSKSNVSWTRVQKIIMVCIALSHVLNNMAYSVLTPFFPLTAEDHGATPSEVGLIFGVYYVSMFVFALITGKLIPVFGLKPTFTVGYVIAAIGNILFGFVDIFEDKSTFLAVCFSLRVLTSMGGAAAITASLTILANCFQGTMSQPMGNIAASAGLGMILGPFVGGLLYEIGGFILPFVAVGVAMFINVIAVSYIIPENAPLNSKVTGSLLHTMCVPGVWVGVISTVLGGVSMSFLEPTLSQELQKFNLDAFETGSVFLLMGVAFSISSPIFGFLADKYNCPRKVVIFGYFGSIIGYIITGPWPIGNISHTLVTICVGIFVLNIGLASGLTAGLQDMIIAAVFNGFTEDTKTYSVLSGIRTCAYSFGAFVGPTLGGILVEQFDFATATLIYGLFTLFVCFMTILFCFWEYRCGKGRRQSVLFSRFFSNSTDMYNERTSLLANAKNNVDTERNYSRGYH
ncbi:MFS-type transporter SLC18B1-like [Antedon mediterranea]|uniref:MFS-type transporter SLC18B1-like n=1 Tax=Antedon mediterranea TaxID=105859 RepID=UPI003AF41CBE